MGVKVRQWKGAWWLFVNHRGQRKAKRVGAGEAGRLAAKEAARQLQARLALGEPMGEQGSTVRFEDYAATWLARMTHTCKHGTYQNYEAAVRRELLPAFSGLTLDHVTRGRVKDLAATVSLTAATDRHRKCHLHAGSRLS